MIEFREEGTRQKAGLQQQIPGEYSMIPSGICLEESLGRWQWDSGELVDIQGSPPPSFKTVHSDNHENEKVSEGLHGWKRSYCLYTYIKRKHSRGRRKETWKEYGDAVWIYWDGVWTAKVQLDLNLAAKGNKSCPYKYIGQPSPLAMSPIICA